MSDRNTMVGELETINCQIQNFILTKFPLARKRGLDGHVPLLESGIVDSMGVLDLVGFLEREFTIQIDDEELTPENFQTINHLATFVGHKRNGTVA